jgi:hypothetical protein
MSERSPVELTSERSYAWPLTDGMHLDEGDEVARARSRPRRIPHRLPLAVLLFGAIVTALLTWTAASANTDSDHRLLKLQVRQAATSPRW